MRKDNVNWTEISNENILRFGNLSHEQRRKGITNLKDYTEVYLKCEDCDKVEKAIKSGHVWNLKKWKSFLRKSQVEKDETNGYYIHTRIEFYCPSCQEPK